MIKNSKEELNILKITIIFQSSNNFIFPINPRFKMNERNGAPLLVLS